MQNETTNILVEKEKNKKLLIANERRKRVCVRARASSLTSLLAQVDLE